MYNFFLFYTQSKKFSQKITQLFRVLSTTLSPALPTTDGYAKVPQVAQ